MDLGFNLAQSNRALKDPTSRQNFGDTSGLLCKNDPILRHMDILNLSRLNRYQEKVSIHGGLSQNLVLALLANLGDKQT